MLLSAAKFLPSIAKGYRARVLRIASMAMVSSRTGGGLASLEEGMGWVPKGRVRIEVFVAAAFSRLARTVPKAKRRPLHERKNSFVLTRDLRKRTTRRGVMWCEEGSQTQEDVRVQLK